MEKLSGWSSGGALRRARKIEGDIEIEKEEIYSILFYYPYIQEPIEMTDKKRKKKSPLHLLVLIESLMNTIEGQTNKTRRRNIFLSSTRMYNLYTYLIVCEMCLCGFSFKWIARRHQQKSTASGPSAQRQAANAFRIVDYWRHFATRSASPDKLQRLSV